MKHISKILITSFCNLFFPSSIIICTFTNSEHLPVQKFDALNCHFMDWKAPLKSSWTILPIPIIQYIQDCTNSKNNRREK